MSYLNINLWFARDIHTDDIVSILDVKQDNKYCCPICNSEAIPKALESKKVTPHFAHIDRSKCSSEAMIHWWYKHRFIEEGDTFTIKTDEEIQFKCKSFEVEKVYSLSNGTYKPDLVVYTECGNEIIFEMANTNKKKVEDYIDQWIELGKIIVEVDIKSMLNDNKTFNALYYNGKCFNFNKRDDGYYKTIGKLKEKMFADGSYDIEKVKQLDWFWKDIVKYKVGEIESSDIFAHMSELFKDKEMYFLIEDIVSRKKCLNLLKEYKNELVVNTKNLIKEITNDYVFSTKVTILESLCRPEIRLDSCFGCIETELFECNINNIIKLYNYYSKLNPIINLIRESLKDYPISLRIKQSCAIESNISHHSDDVFTISLYNSMLTTHNKIDISDNSNLTVITEDIIKDYKYNYHNKLELNGVNCTECNDVFDITFNEYKFFKRNMLKLPKRCKSCRQKRKQNK